MKWSDGEAFDTDDVMFRYNDFALNEDLRAINATRKLIVSGEEPGH